MKREIMERVFDKAIKDLKNTPKLRDNLFPQEDQLRAALYKAFRNEGFGVYASAKYVNNGRMKCDLVVIDKKQIWIELKVVTSEGSINTHGKRWKKDIKKLKNLCPDNVNRMFILWYFYNKNQKISGKSITYEKICGLTCLKKPIYNSSAKDFDWNQKSYEMILCGWDIKN
jgi:hypothetical protein